MKNAEGTSVWRRVGGFFLDLVEIYAPAVSFSVMFLSFVVGIFFRYALNHPLTWTHELSILGFIWTTMLGACFARRMGSHVAFTLVYDKAQPRTQLWIRLAGNLLMAGAFAAAFYKTADFVQFMGFQKTPVLRIPFNIGYFPYLVFMVFIFARIAVDLVRDIAKLLRGEL
jgi:C4-dicarboxylate transporter DctQ subunit